MSSNLQKKLFQFEASPPKEAWEKIADALESDASFSRRLYHFEQDPPLKAWNAITAVLDEAPLHHTKVVSFFTRYKTPLRYIAAASVIAVLLVAINLTVPHTAAGSLASNSKLSHPVQQVKQREQNRDRFNPSETEPSLTATISQANTEEDKSKFASVKRVLAYIRPQKILSSFALRKSFIPQQAEQKVFFDQSSVDDFMVYSDGNGNAMKLPKKLFSLVCCKDGDGSCQVRLQRLRQTLSASVASADFAGMIDMLRQLQ